MAQLYVEGNAVDLEGNEVAMTYQGPDLGSLKTKGSFSNTFFAPFSANNDQIFENASTAQSDTNKPYELLQCNVIIDGVDVANQGRLYIQDTANGYNLNVFSGNKTLFDELKSKSIRDLDLSEWDHDWTIEHILEDGAKDFTEGYVYPLLNYGPMSRPSVAELDVRYLHHCFYVHTLIDKIFEESSFTLTNALSENSFYKSLVLPVVDSNLKATRANADNIFSISTDSQIPYTFTDYTSGDKIRWSGTVVDPQEGLNATKDTYTLPAGFQGRVYAKLIIDPLFANTNGEWVFKLNRNGSPVIEKFVTQPGSITLSLPTETGESFSAGDTFSVTWEGFVDGDIMLLDQGSGLFTEPSDALVYRGEVNCEEVLPDISQADLLKTILQIFGGFITTKRDQAEISTIKNIVNRKNFAPNWSDKKKKKGSQQRWYASKTTRIGNYAQKNYFRYADDQLVSNNLGDGYFAINDKTLSASTTIFTLPFAASDGMEILSNYGVAIVPKWTEYDETDEVFVEEGKPKPRILYVNHSDLLPFYTDGDVSTQPSGGGMVAHFIGRNDHNLGFDDSVIVDWYGDLVRLLDRAQGYNVWLKLSPLDVLDIDYFTPIYLEQASAYFMIQKINDYIEGELTQVELIKL